MVKDVQDLQYQNTTNVYEGGPISRQEEREFGLACYYTPVQTSSCEKKNWLASSKYLTKYTKSRSISLLLMASLHHLGENSTHILLHWKSEMDIGPQYLQKSRLQDIMTESYDLDGGIRNIHYPALKTR